MLRIGANVSGKWGERLRADDFFYINAPNAFYLWSPDKKYGIGVPNVNDLRREEPEKEIFYMVDRAYVGDTAITQALSEDRDMSLYSKIWKNILDS